MLGNWAKGKYFRNVIWNTKLTLPLAQRGSWHVVRPGLAQITYRDPASIPVFDLIDDQDRAGKVEALKKEMEVNEKCEAMRDNDIAKQKVELTLKIFHEINKMLKLVFKSLGKTVLGLAL